MSNYDDTSTKSSSEEDPLYSISFENARLEEENKNLKRTIQFYQTELEKFRTPPFIVSEVISMGDEGKAIVRLPNQSNFYVEISQEVQEPVNVGDMVLNEQKSLVIMGKVDMSKNFPVENFVIVNNKPEVSWDDIGGLHDEVTKVKEVLEMPMNSPKLFQDMGISPPKGVLLHGPPGTGKTMIAKALAAATNSTFIELVGSELVQKFIGEGAKLVKDLFEYARKQGPTIIFIDELDAIASRRMETGTSGEREVQRTFMQLLGEIDGFDALSNVKIIAATNRMDILDEAILRPGRLERHIEVKMPDVEGREEILSIQTKPMKLEANVNFKEVANRTENFTGAELRALVTEAGYEAIRKNKKKVSQSDFLGAVDRVKDSDDGYELLSASYS